MNGSISIVTNVVSDIADRLEAVAAEVDDMQPVTSETFLGADAIQVGFDALVDGLASLQTGLLDEVEALRSEARQIGDAFLDLDRRIAASIDGPSLGSAGVGAGGTGSTGGRH